MGRTERQYCGRKQHDDRTVAFFLFLKWAAHILEYWQLPWALLAEYFILVSTQRFDIEVCTGHLFASEYVLQV